jgi:hypothetical protein
MSSILIGVIFLFTFFGFGVVIYLAVGFILVAAAALTTDKPEPKI